MLITDQKKVLIYRISTLSRNKFLDGFNKLRLLDTWLSHEWDSVHIVADNCSAEIVDRLQQLTHQATVHLTSLGNTGSFIFCLELAENCSADDIIYLQEDDYYISGINFAELNSLMKTAHFISLYSHPDKYPWSDMHNLSLSDLCDYKFSEQTRLYLSTRTRRWWRTTSSTTLSFISKKRHLRLYSNLFKIFVGKKTIPRDELVWRLITHKYYKNIKVSTVRKLVKNFLIFVVSIFVQKRLLLVPVETVSIHLDSNAMSAAELSALLNE